MYWDLPEDEQDAIRTWTDLAREIRGVRPKGPDELQVSANNAEQEQETRRRAVACADDPFSIDLPEPRRFTWRACVIILAAAIAIYAVFRLGMAVQVELGRVGHG